MDVKRCHHCQTSDGTGVELLLYVQATCPKCFCTWGVHGKHVFGGSIEGERYAFPQPQHWREQLSPCRSCRYKTND